VNVLDEIEGWPCEHAAAAVVAPDGVVEARGDQGHEFRWASVTKLLTTEALLVALEEGILDLDQPAGPEGSTIRHLAAHASGLPLDAGRPIALPGRKRIYSNQGIELLAEAIAAAAEMPFAEYLRAAVTGPLGLSRHLSGSPASGYRGTLGDLAALAAELLAPRLVAAETLDEAVTVQFPGLSGVVPGFGRQEQNDWGLGFELRDAKSPHWTSRRNSPRTFGHFGASGTFLWVDPEPRLALAVLTDLDFGQWAREAWPRLADAALAEYAGVAE
jgi:CubicO group peptidase (beta-lactamase class C family)